MTIEAVEIATVREEINEEQVEKDEEINLYISPDKNEDSNRESLRSRGEMGGIVG